MRIAIAVALGLWCAACPAPLVLEAPVAPVCLAGSVASADGCEPVLPAAPCAVGTVAQLGQADCQPVGVTSCEAGFRPVADGGWGCEAVLPPGPCFQAGYATPGDAACQPLGDCGAAFPPADATHFVDASYTAGQLDGTHFATISAALAAAPAGAVIAVEAGSYSEGLAFTRAQRVVGRCAAQVVVRSAGSTAPGLEVRAHGVTVSGLTLTGHRGGAVVVGAADLTARDCDFVDNRDLGVAAFNTPAHVTLERCTVQRTHPMAGGALGRGVEIEGGATVTISHSLVEDNAEAGIFVTDPGSALELSDSVVRLTRASGDGTVGRGVYVKKRAQAVIRRSALVQNHDVAVYLADATAEVTDSVLADTLAPPALTFGRGVSAYLGASATVTNTTLSGMVGAGLDASASSLTVVRSVVAGTRSDGNGEFGTGLFAKDGAVVSLTHSALVDSRTSGLVADGAGTRVSAEDSLVLRTAADGNGLYGFGVVAAGGAVSLTRSAVVSSRWAGVIAAAGSLALLQSIVSRVAPATDGTYGHGVTVLADCRVDLASTLVERSAGVGLVSAGGWGTVRDSWVRHNTIGVSAQAGSTLRLYDVVPEAPAALELAVSTNTAFEDNAAMLGDGPVPVPPMPP